MGFWAPQIIKDGNRYLFAYTANEQTVLAASDSLNGIYTQAEPLPIDGSEKNIDPFLFTDSDGRSYLYHVRFDTVISLGWRIRPRHRQNKRGHTPALLRQRPAMGSNPRL